MEQAFGPLADGQQGHRRRAALKAHDGDSPGIPAESGDVVPYPFKRLDLIQEPQIEGVGIILSAGDFRKVLPGLSGTFDVILMDPPYNKGLLDEALEIISEHGLLAEGGVIVCEHRKEEDIPDQIGTLTKEKERRYGIVKLSIYR